MKLTEETIEEVKKVVSVFIRFCDEKNMSLHGPVFNPLLGMHYPQPLCKDDIPNVINDYIEYLKQL
jgi:hypothetical protein